MARMLGSALGPVLGFSNWALSPFHPTPAPPTLPVKGAVKPVPPTSEAQLDTILHRLDSNKQAWVDLPDADKAKLLRRCIKSTIAVSREAAEVATKVKGTWGSGIAEEHIAFTPIVSGLREYAEALEAGGEPAPNARRQLPSGQHILDMFPTGLEALLFGGWKGEIWVRPGKEPTQGTVRHTSETAGKVALVLGAGNQAPVAALDILHKLVAENAVVVCKMNPVNEYLGPFIRRAFEPLVELGFVEIVYGAGKQGAFLCNHPLVASILLTGSSQTYDAIVWGSDKSKTKKAVQKPVDGELGCVTPYVICPGGNWSEADLEFQAGQVATGLAHNAGHNCVKAELVITAEEWPLREKFLAALRRQLSRVPARAAFYPGSADREAQFCKAFPDAEKFGGGEGAMPWRLQAGLLPDEARTDAENWCGVLQEVALPGAQMADPSLFLPAVTKFANERCWGSLSCSLFVHPEVQAQHRQAFDDAVAGLKYGSVCINVTSIMGFCITRLPWGAFPGNTPEDIGSGNCAVHNTCLVDHPQKGVLRAPWRVVPTPFWSPFARNAEALAPRALQFMGSPSLVSMTPLSVSALLC